VAIYLGIILLSLRVETRFFLTPTLSTSSKCKSQGHVETALVAPIPKAVILPRLFPQIFHTQEFGEPKTASCSGMKGRSKLDHDNWSCTRRSESQTSMLSQREQEHIKPQKAQIPCFVVDASPGVPVLHDDPLLGGIIARKGKYTRCQSLFFSWGDKRDQPMIEPQPNRMASRTIYPDILTGSHLPSRGSHHQIGNSREGVEKGCHTPHFFLPPFIFVSSN
jgi:hypothetical protein